MLSVFRKLARWRRPALLATALALEAWLLLTPDRSLDGAPFVVLCALSCWLPAWLCADLLSIHTRSNPEPHREWAPREFLAKARSRLGLYLPALTVWVGTWTARALAYDLRPRTRPMFSFNLAENSASFVGTWLAWTLVFLASALAYAAGAALLSAICRRPRRWLLVPMLVVAISIGATGLLEWLLPGQFQVGVTTSVTHPVTNWQGLLLGPNYLLGTTVAFGVLQGIQSLPEPTLKVIGPLLGGGISQFCWPATCFFLFITAGAVGITWWVAYRRHRRHPHTISRDMVTEPLLDLATQPAALPSEPVAPAVVPEQTEQCLST